MSEIEVQIAEILSGKKLIDLTEQESAIVGLLPHHLTTAGRGKTKRLATTDFAKLERKRVWEDTLISMGR